MSKIVITNAVVIGTDTGDVLRGTDIVIEDDTVTAMGSGVGATIVDATVIDATGAIVMPGLIDTHLHAWEFAWRGITMRKNNGYDYMDLLWKAHSAYEPADTMESVLGASLEMLDNGITGVLDFMHGANKTSDHTDGAAEAYRTTGQRVLMAVGTKALYDAPADVFENARKDRIADVERLIAANADQPQLNVGTALITPDARLWPLFREDVADSRSIGARMTFHANEIGEFHRMHVDGLLGSDIVPSHGNRASEPELHKLAEAGVILSVSPYTEISSGKSPGVVNRAVRAGVRVAISIDTPPSCVPLNEFTQLRQFWTSLILFDQLAAREGARFPIDYNLDPQTLTLDHAVDAATVNGALALGYDNLGRIAPGYLADVIVVRPTPGDVALVDPAAYVVMSQPSAAEVTDVIVAGVVKKRAGVLVGVNGVAVEERNARVRERVLSLIA